MSNPIFCHIRNGESDKQLICFPFLGGNMNSFSALFNELPENWDVWTANPPGHLGSSLPMIKEIDPLTEIYEKELMPIIKPDCLLFGHSMGAVVAFSLASKLCRISNGGAFHCRLVLSASGVPTKLMQNDSVISDNSLLNFLVSYGAVPDTVLHDDEILKILMPIFRADYAILEDAAEKQFSPVNITSYLICGGNDKLATLSRMLKWQELISGNIFIYSLPEAKHMFIQQNPKEVSEILKRIMLQNIVVHS